MTQLARHLGPDGVDIIVEGPKGKDLELWLFVVEEAEDAGRGNKTRHGGGVERGSERWELAGRY